MKFAAFKESKVGLILAERRAIPICCSAIEPLEAEARARRSSSGPLGAALRHTANRSSRSTPDKHPFDIAGSDAAGIVWAVGSKARRSEVGDEVVVHYNQDDGDDEEWREPASPRFAFLPPSR